MIIAGHIRSLWGTNGHLLTFHFLWVWEVNFQPDRTKHIFSYSPDTFNLQTQIFPQIRSLSLPYFESAIFVPRKYPKVDFFRLCFHLFTACHNQLNPNHLTGDKSYFTSFTPCLTLFQTFCWLIGLFSDPKRSWKSLRLTVRKYSYAVFSYSFFPKRKSEQQLIFFLGDLSKNSVYFKKSKLYFLKSKPYFFQIVINSENHIQMTVFHKKTELRKWSTSWRSSEGAPSPRIPHKQRKVKGWRIKREKTSVSIKTVNSQTTHHQQSNK